MAARASHLDTVAAIAKALTDLGLAPVLVGGMALVILGSRRVTRDFDFVVRDPGDRMQRLLDLFYDRGLQLAARVNDDGDVTSTIDNRKVAAARLRLDSPSSAYFYDVDSGLRIDLLFDFPIPAVDLARRATPTKLRSHVLLVASAADLLSLKKTAHAARSSGRDEQDIAFLEKRRGKRR